MIKLNLLSNCSIRMYLDVISHSISSQGQSLTPIAQGQMALPTSNNSTALQLLAWFHLHVDSVNTKLTKLVNPSIMDLSILSNKIGKMVNQRNIPIGCRPCNLPADWASYRVHQCLEQPSAANNLQLCSYSVIAIAIL